jgi:hypothetical protein
VKLRDDVNEHGTPVTWFRCETCGGEFTVCPAVPPEREANWTGCLADECSSYDPARDASIYFAPDDLDLIEGVDPGEGFLGRTPI